MVFQFLKDLGLGLLFLTDYVDFDIEQRLEGIRGFFKMVWIVLDFQMFFFDFIEMGYFFILFLLNL